eukprot:1129630-Amorphochlora_amoeboformis.AAC.1
MGRTLAGHTAKTNLGHWRDGSAAEGLGHEVERPTAVLGRPPPGHMRRLGAGQLVMGLAWGGEEEGEWQSRL